MNKQKRKVPSTEEIQEELDKVKSLDDFFGREGLIAKLVGPTIQEILNAEMDEHLGYKKHEYKGRNSGNNRNGSYKRKLRSSSGEIDLEVPRDRNGEFESDFLDKYSVCSNELERKILSMYSRGISTRDIHEEILDLYGVEVSSTLVSQITDRVLPLVEEWQNRPLQEFYAIIYLDCIHVKIRREGKIKNTAIYTILGVDLEGKKDILGHWVGKGGEGSNYWLKVISDLKNRGTNDVLIACVDGLKGFSEAIHAVYPETIVQKCIIHQIRNSLKYVSWKDKKEFMRDLKEVYKAKTLEEAESSLRELSNKWSDKYGLSIKSWEDNWDELSTYFDYTPKIRKIIYTTNIIEGYYRQIRKVIKSKNMFPTENSVRKMFYLINDDITRKWTMPIQDWSLILNQLAIKFEGRCGL